MRGAAVFILALLVGACSDPPGPDSGATAPAGVASFAGHAFGAGSAYTEIARRDLSHATRSRADVWITADVASIDAAIATTVNAATDLQRACRCQGVEASFYQLDSSGGRALMPLVVVEFSPDGKGFNGFSNASPLLVMAASRLQTSAGIAVGAGVVLARRD